MYTGIVASVVVGVIIAWSFIGRRNVPKYPPLKISDEDPLMIEARQKAKSTTKNFLELIAGEYSEAQIKVPFITSSGMTEHLWAEVLKHEGDILSVRYYTPPVTHTGKLERLHSHNISEISDWVVILKNGMIHGGLTQRVMFQRGKEQWGQLPPELLEQESKYVA
jgi:uncharacterized protein YegJ (DUF2314 family)